MHILIGKALICLNMLSSNIMCIDAIFFDNVVTILNFIIKIIIDLPANEGANSYKNIAAKV